MTLHSEGSGRARCNFERAGLPDVRFHEVVTLTNIQVDGLRIRYFLFFWLAIPTRSLKWQIRKYSRNQENSRYFGDILKVITYGMIEAGQ